MEESNYPTIIESSIKMEEPNNSIIIYEGGFTLKNGSQEFVINGIITYDWFPNSGVRFEGNIQNSTIKLAIGDFDENSEVYINTSKLGKILITNINTKNFDKNTFVKGIITNQVIMGDKSIPVEKLVFSVPNLRVLFGSAVQKISQDGTLFSMNRLILKNKKYNIKLDKCYNYEFLQSSLKAKGGYVLQYHGEITGKKGAIKHSDIQEVFYCFNKFISFLNGRRTSAIFIQGIYDNEIKWADYTPYLVDLYKYVPSWPPRHSILGINESWGKFSDLWQNKTDKDFLSLVIHWYVEANNHSGFVIGSIIMAQTALELIYNYLIIEKKGILLGKDAENISAANKIRLVLSQLNISYKIPASFSYLTTYFDENKEVSDAPDAIVQIRNAIVHSQEEKRKKLALIKDKALYETLQVCIWYIEMSILYVLEFNGTYFNRCSGARNAGDGEELVPWIKK